MWSFALFERSSFGKSFIRFSIGFSVDSTMWPLCRGVDLESHPIETVGIPRISEESKAQQPLTHRRFDACTVDTRWESLTVHRLVASVRAPWIGNAQTSFLQPALPSAMHRTMYVTVWTSALQNVKAGDNLSNCVKMLLIICGLQWVRTLVESLYPVG